MEPKKSNLVVKDNQLTESSYRLTLIEQRIILAAIMLARESQSGLGKGYVKIEAKWFAELFNMDEADTYGQLRDAIKTLFHRFIVIHDTDPDSKQPRRTELHWISEASYIEGAGKIQFCFTQSIIPYITCLEKNFTRYKLEKIAGMTSPYAIRLYELLINWGKDFTKHQEEVEITWLKNVLVLEKEYERIGNLKARVIDVAINQINTHSDLTVTYEQKKTGRNVTHLIFHMQKKEEPKPEKPKKAPAASKKTTAAKPQPVTAPTIQPGYARCKCGTVVNLDNYRCTDCGRTAPNGLTPKEKEIRRKAIQEARAAMKGK